MFARCLFILLPIFSMQLYRFSYEGSQTGPEHNLWRHRRRNKATPAALLPVGFIVCCRPDKKKLIKLTDVIHCRRRKTRGFAVYFNVSKLMRHTFQGWLKKIAVLIKNFGFEVNAILNRICFINLVSYNYIFLHCSHSGLVF